jgi:carbonic anhydrase
MEKDLRKVWDFSNSNRWSKYYPECKSKNQSPININTSDIVDCNQTCRLSLLYKPSKCYVSNKNGMPVVRFDPGNYIRFLNKDYQLTKMTIHSPSMHTLNKRNYHMELNFYHCSNPANCETSNSGGVILSVLLRRGDANSDVNSFLSEFINQIPTKPSPINKVDEYEIPVNKKWSPENALPNNKQFFYYNGSLPYPPCHEKWTWIIFEEVQTIGRTNFDIFKHSFDKTNRLVRRVGDRPVFYNSEPKFNNYPEKRRYIIEKTLKKLKKEREQLMMSNKDKILKRKVDYETINIEPDDESNFDIHRKQANEVWYEQNKLYIKGGILILIFLVLVFCAYKLIEHFVIKTDKFDNFQNSVVKEDDVKPKQYVNSLMSNKTPTPSSTQSSSSEKQKVEKVEKVDNLDKLDNFEQLINTSKEKMKDVLKNIETSPSNSTTTPTEKSKVKNLEQIINPSTEKIKDMFKNFGTSPSKNTTTP